MAKGAQKKILENLTTAVVTFDRDLALTSINPAGEVLFATSSKKVLGQRLAHLLPQGRRFARTLERTLQSLHPFTARGVALRLPGGQAITLDCTVTPLVDGGLDLGLLVELSQVDRLLRLAQEENILDRQAANRAVIRGLAHEIKNPLGGLRGAAQLLERQLPDPALKEYTRIIIEEADRLRNLVDRMVGPNRLPQKEPLSIHQILEYVRTLILAEVHHGVTIRRDYDPSIPDLVGDREQLIQAVLNIVRNSVQAIDRQGTIRLRTRIERQFTIAHKRHRLVLRIEIEDDGPGIPEHLRKHIFYPMVTGRAEGMGLGLPIAQDVINQHGGLIECESQPKRTVFRIYLPLENSHGK